MISTIHPIPAFSDNYIWAIREAGSYRICVVDPGDAHPVIDYLNSNDYQLSDILIPITTPITPAEFRLSWILTTVE